jgi:ParB-like chromosome segregation protein Spo0J
MLDLAKIRLDGGTQTRVSINEEVIAVYADAMEENEKFPPVVVYSDGTDYWLADGFHRVLAATRVGRLNIEATIHKGSRQDALKYALRANKCNGLHRSNEDKRNCVKMALAEWPDWSDRKIAEACGVSNATVGTMRTQLFKLNSSPPSNGQSRQGRDGKKRKAPAPKPPKKVTGGVTFNVEELEDEVEVESEDPDSLEAVQADLREYEEKLRDLARFARKILGAKKQEVKRPWCCRYSLLTVVQPLEHIARTILNDLPVGGEADDPVLAHQKIVEQVG